MLLYVSDKERAHHTCGARSLPCRVDATIFRPGTALRFFPSIEHRVFLRIRTDQGICVTIREATPKKASLNSPGESLSSVRTPPSNYSDRKSVV